MSKQRDVLIALLRSKATYKLIAMCLATVGLTQCSAVLTDAQGVIVEVIEAILAA